MTVNSTTGAMNEATVNNEEIYENAPATTFDDLDEEVTPNQDGSNDDDAWGDEEEGKQAPEDKLGSEELKLLNDSDGSEEEAPKKKEEPKEEIQTEEEPAEQTEEEKLAEASAEAGKKLRVKIGDDHYSLDSNAKLKVKIDGQNEEVTVQDLINNYSGKVAYDKKFTEIGNKNKELVQKEQQLKHQVASIEAKLAPIFDVLKDPLKDPFEALELLVDISGNDSYDFYKRSLNARVDELVKLSQMSETEQEAYFLKLQNERLLKSNEKRTKSEQEALQSKQLRDHVDQLREAYKVSVDQYSEAFDELADLLPGQKLTHQQIVDYASLKPLSPKIEEILKPYADEIDDSDYWSVVTHLSRSLRDGKLSEQQIQKIVKDEYGIKAPVKELNTKLNIGKNKTPPKKEETPKNDAFESFDDLED